LLRKKNHLQFEEKENPKINKSSDEALAYQQGFLDGSSGQPSDYYSSMHKNIKIRNAYIRGYDIGENITKESLKQNPHLQFEEQENPKAKKQLPFRRFFPKIKPGRPAGGPKGGYWWILDLYDSKERKLGHLVGKGTKEKATLDAKYKVGDKYKGKEIMRAMLSGPYSNKPTSKTRRK
jgi:hypothetical protein